MNKEEFKKKLDKKSRELIELLNDPDNSNPHVSLTITPTSYDLFSGIIGSGQILDYVKD